MTTTTAAAINVRLLPPAAAVELDVAIELVVIEEVVGGGVEVELETDPDVELEEDKVFVALVPVPVDDEVTVVVTPPLP